MTQTATSPQRKPLLDEASFQQLLSAAFVLQEHNDRLQAKAAHGDFAKNLSAIVETQKLIQTLQLDLAAASELVAERVQKITNASGTAIGIIEKGQLFYRATTGSAAVDAGARVSLESSLSAHCLSKGSALNCPDVSANSQLRAELFRQREVNAFIAVPVYHAGQVAGVLELRFANANSFRESDLRSAELMAGLLSEAMVTAARMKWKEALASERQSMLEALERIKPQLERLGSESPTLDEVIAVRPPVAPAVSPVAAKSEALVPRSGDTCSACGSDFFDESESFCGICGAARPIATARGTVHSKDAQHKTDTPWLIPYGQEDSPNGNSRAAARDESAGADASTMPASLQEIIALSTNQKDTKPEARSTQTIARNAVETHPASQTEHALMTASEPDSLTTNESGRISTQLAPGQDDSLNIVPVAPSDQVQPYPWTSARKAQGWLETVKTHHGPRTEWLAQQWQRRRANIYLAAAALILLVVISGWGTRPATTVAGNQAPAQKGQQQAPPPPRLTLFEKLLVNLGLAEPPPAPSYMGNPDTQVWVDVHTALYHCPGSDLYGKTADGRFTTQRDAQQDQFEPANRKACP